MENITVKDVVKVTGGFLLCGDENTVLTDICTDSRKIQQGDLFVPIIGEHQDAHRYIESAMEIGAATLTSEHNDVVISEKAFIRVDDTTKALQDIGGYIRSRYDIPVIGVTGSVGKTTTREMIAAAIGSAKKCYQTKRNYNSQIGVPITLSGLTAEAEAAVIEMGISEPGQMEILSNLVKPDICVVTNIGVAHIEFMKTQENICREKLSITSHMKDGGLLLINGDDELLVKAAENMKYKTLTYGLGEACDFRGVNIRIENSTTIFDCVYKNKKLTVTLNALGKHNVRNALAGIAVSHKLGIPMETSAKALESFEGQRQRVIQLPNRYTIIDDTYNASPDSVKASIDVLCDIGVKGKRYIVLGDMLELGEKSIQYHRQIGEYLRDKRIDNVIVIGEYAQEIKRALDESTVKYAETYVFTDREEIGIYLMATMKPEDIVLIKGSNGMKLNELVNFLTN